MTEAVTISGQGIKCDAAGCDYRDPNVGFDSLQEYHNKPCPKCGANLLTDEDFAALKAIIAMTKWANAVIGSVEPSDKPPLVIRTAFDGSGIPSVSVTTGDESEDANG